ncbi:MAG: tetratricopeptide repeat protein [bacterium]
MVLFEGERRSLAAKPTENLEAYELYIRAGKYNRGRLEDIRIAVQLLERATELDPQFALAYVRLSRFHSGAFFFGQDRSETRRTRAKEAVERALELDPELPEAYLTLGYYYYEGEGDYERALKEFAIARRGLPSEVSILFAEALIWRRQGKLEETAENLKKALALHPRSFDFASHLGLTLGMLRQFAEAEVYHERAIVLGPDRTQGYTWQALNYLAWQGDTQRAHAVLERMPEGIGHSGPNLKAWMYLHRIEGSYQQALALLTALPREAFSSQPWFISRAQLLGEVYLALGDTLQARAAYDSARTLLEREVAQHPNDSRLRNSLGLVYAGLGRKQDAMREGRLAIELRPVSEDYMHGLTSLESLARIYAAVGETELAIEQLEYLLSASFGTFVSRALLRSDPIWEPLRGNPGFKRLLGKS